MRQEQPERVGGHQNAAYAGGRKVELSVGGVEGFVCGAVLVHLDGKTEPGFDTW